MAVLIEQCIKIETRVNVLRALCEEVGKDIVEVWKIVVQEAAVDPTSQGSQDFARKLRPRLERIMGKITNRGEALGGPSARRGEERPGDVQ